MPLSKISTVVPAQAGTHSHRANDVFMGPRFRGDDPRKNLQ
jgi:hypothetical protein